MASDWPEAFPDVGRKVNDDKEDSSAVKDDCAHPQEDGPRKGHVRINRVNVMNEPNVI